MPSMNLRTETVKMETPETKIPNQICTITLVFPVDTDDEAIALKKKIDIAVSETPKVRVDFRIMNMGRPGV